MKAGPKPVERSLAGTPSTLLRPVPQLPAGQRQRRSCQPSPEQNHRRLHRPGRHQGGLCMYVYVLWLWGIGMNPLHVFKMKREN